MSTKNKSKNNRSKKIPRVVLLDSHAILHRAYHALPEFTSSKGEPTGALFGLASMLISIIRELRPDYIIAAFDLPKPTYRHEVYADYKAGRKETDSELSAQIRRAYDLYRALSIPICEEAGYEADDILGTLAQNLKKEAQVIIASGDMDTLQLVDDDQVQVYTLKKGIKDTILYNEDAVRERFGFGPELLPDYKGLRGDASDNIIGVPGIGEKTATTLLTKIGDIEKIYKALGPKPIKKDKQKRETVEPKDSKKFADAGIKERVLRLLAENREEAEFSKMLATIECSAPINFTLPKKPWLETVSADAVQAMFREFDFRTLAVRIKDVLPKETAEEAAKKAGQGELRLGDEGSMGAESSRAESFRAESLDCEAVDTELFAEARVALWLINSAITNPDLDDVLNFTGEKNLKDAYKVLQKKLAEDGLEKVFETIERSLISVITKMEKAGVKIDRDFLADLSREYHKELATLEKEIWKMVGSEFNINSSQQLAEVLFNRLGLRYKSMRKTSTGKFSTREDVLQKMRGEHPIIEKILEYREFQKLLSTYIDNIPAQVGDDGRLHANFLQTGTTTGRMASNNPNLQNIPIGTDRGRRIRNAFVAEKGNALVAFDYSQIELRIASILSGDEKLQKVFKDGADIHTSVAAEIFEVSPEKVTKEQRRQAKVINFGILYGMGVNALRENLNNNSKNSLDNNPNGEATTRADAQDFYNRYFGIYSDLAKYLDKTKAEATKRGYTTTMFGRRRYFEGFKSRLPYIRAQAERMAINAPIQGTQADLTKLAMVRIDEYLRREKIADRARLILQIHDELIYEMDEALIEEHAPKIREIMEGVLTAEETAGVPIVADCSVGPNWGEMEKLNS